MLAESWNKLCVEFSASKCCVICNSHLIVEFREYFAALPSKFNK